MQQIIVDAYNVAHVGAPRISRGGGELETLRRRLVDDIERYVTSRSIRITVVFDGAGSAVDTEVIVPGRLQVVYSRKGQTADALILEILERHANPREYIVVTNDMADIGRRAGALGANLMSSEAFLKRIRKEENRRAEPASHEPGETDVDYWLEKFERRNEREPRDE